MRNLIKTLSTILVVGVLSIIGCRNVFASVFSSQPVSDQAVGSSSGGITEQNSRLPDSVGGNVSVSAGTVIVGVTVRLRKDASQTYLNYRYRNSIAGSTFCYDASLPNDGSFNQYDVSGWDNTFHEVTLPLNCTIPSGFTQFTMQWYFDSNGSDVPYVANKSGVGNYNYIYEDVLPVVDTSTRFISITPSYASTTGTSTSIGAHVYVSPDDYESGTVLHIRLVNNTAQNGIGGSVLDAWNASFGGIDIPLSSGDNDVSTSTVFDLLGQVNWDLSIQVPNTTFLIGSFLSPNVLVSTSSLFYVVAPTGLDIAMASTSDVLISALITGTTTQSVLRCNPTDFDITTCLISLIIPSQSVLLSDFEQARTLLLTKFPIGYVTRFISILTETATSSLPSIAYTFSSSSPLYFIGSIHFDPLGDISSSTSPLNYVSDQSVPKSFWEIVDPTITIIIYLALLFMIIHDLTGIHKHARHKKQ